MHRFLVEPGTLQAGTVRLDPGESRHAAVVLRLRPGDPVTLLDGAGTVAEARLVEVSPRSVAAEVVARHAVPPRRGEVVLAAALTKGKAWDWTIQKATELGVAGIVALSMKRSVVRVDRADAEAKREDWRRGAIEAAKQCGTPWLPRIEGPFTPGEWLARGPAVDAGLVAALTPGTLEVAEALARVPEARRVALVIGPEGDMDEAELRAFLEAGFQPVTLGPTVLRAETAATAGIAVISACLRVRKLGA